MADLALSVQPPEGASPPLHEVGRRVRAFYAQYPFPTYEPTDSPGVLAEKAQAGVFASLLDRQIPYNARILDAGCGTGQLPIFLSLPGRRTVGIDFSLPSLMEGRRFVHRFSLKDVDLIQMDLFMLGLKDESFDYVITTGVLHHTADPYRVFQGLCGLLRPGGYILIGLYNRYARIPTMLRRWIFRRTGRRFEWLDSVLRHGRDEAKKHIWFADQYANPHETVHTVDEVMQWFAANEIECMGVVPSLTPGAPLTPADRPFEPVPMGKPLGRVLGQLVWMFTIGREGGLFVMIGRRVVSA
ncbi:MAG: class I SAM-dependent methyltransferase [Candidatus Methylomirabilales bacterium]